MKVANDILPGYTYQTTEDARPGTQELDGKPGTVNVIEDNATMILTAEATDDYEDVIKKFEKIANGPYEWAILSSSSGEGVGMKAVNYRGYDILLEAQKEGDRTFVVFFIIS